MQKIKASLLDFESQSSDAPSAGQSPPDFWEDIFNQVIAINLPSAALVVGLIYAVLATSLFFTAPETYNRSATISASIVSVAGLSLWLLLRRLRMPPMLANPMLALLIALCQAQALHYMSVTQEMRQTILVLFVVLGASQFFLSTRWFLLMLNMIVISWWWMAWQLPMSAYYFGFILLMGLIASSIMFVVRQRAHERYERLRMQDAARQSQLQHRARQLETSQQLGQHILSILDLDELLSEVVNLIQDEYTCDYVGIFLVGEKDEALYMRAGTGELGRQLTRKKLVLPIDSQSLVGWVAKNGRYINIDNVTTEPRYMNLKPEMGVRSELDLPLLMGSRVMGVITLQSTQYEAFAKADIPFLQLITTQVAIATYNASLYHREKLARNLAETLQETGHALTSTLEWNAVLDVILQRLDAIVRYDRAAVLVQRSRVLKMVSTRGFPTDSDPSDIMISLDNDSIFRQIVETKRPLSLLDAQQRADWQSIDQLPPARSWLGVPLLHAGSVIGMLSLTRESLSPYSEEEIRLADSFARQAAIALENARLYEETTRFNQQLEYEVRQRTDAIQTAYVELEQLNRNKSDFISVVSHELRTPLTILHGYTQMLLQDSWIQEDEMRRFLVNGIQTGSSRLSDIINSMLDVVKIENRELNLHPTPVSLPGLIKMVIDDLQRALKERHVTLVVENMANIPLLMVDPEMVQKVIFHLITNAVKYTPDGGIITVSGNIVDQVCDENPEPGVEIVIADTGIGIDPDVQQIIFTKFFQTGEVSLHSSSKTQFKGGGPGLGLAIAKGFVEAHGGRIWVESPGYDETRNPGSHFHLVFPLSLQVKTDSHVLA